MDNFNSPEHIQVISTNFYHQLGIYEHPFIDTVEETNDDPTAHLDVDSEKVLTYISASKDHSFIKKKILPLKSLTYKLFDETNEEEGQQQEDGDEEEGERPDKFIYVEDVVRQNDPKMHYFRIPKLGSYIAVPLVYQSCLDEEAFKTALKDKQKVLQQVRVTQETKDGEKLDYLAKREELLDMPDSEAQVKELDEEWANKEWPTYDCEPYEYTNHYYAVCADTLG